MKNTPFPLMENAPPPFFRTEQCFMIFLGSFFSSANFNAFLIQSADRSGKLAQLPKGLSRKVPQNVGNDLQSRKGTVFELNLKEND